MKVDIQISTSQKGHFSNVFICFNELVSGHLRKVQLRFFDFTRIHDFTRDTISHSFDFYFLSAIIYGMDDLFSRNKYSINGWAREFEVIIPVNNPDIWNKAADKLSDVVSFLTGDFWSISFSKLTTSLYEPVERNDYIIPPYDHADYSFASLFSGGLDSLIGVINELNGIQAGKKGVLISHADGAHPGPKIDQDRILPQLRMHYTDKFDHFRLRVGLANLDHLGEKVDRDSNQRSRSILFLGLGVYIVNSVPNVNDLLLPENGTISLNHPLTPSRTSSLSTRTTHPYFIAELQKVLSSVGISIRLMNPFSFKTKGEMVNSCKDADVLRVLYSDSASCGKRGHTSHWDQKNAKQCGVCMPCIYRRASLHVKSFDNENFGKDLLSHVDPINSSPDMPALFDYLKSHLSVEEIKRNLLVNGSIPFDKLVDYANVVVRSRSEIKKWIKDKGSTHLKNILGIK